MYTGRNKNIDKLLSLNVKNKKLITQALTRILLE